MESNIILLSILVVAIIGKANSVALASCILFKYGKISFPI